jgi:hypothetical protein
MLSVHFTPGDGKGWALDEDLRQTRVALAGVVRESGPAGADVIEAAFWQNLEMVAPELLSRAYVIAHADNPPFFYVKQAGFARGQRVVDLWIARSQEACAQFEALGLPYEHVPYTIDPALFFPLTGRRELREKFGIPGDAYVIANFHRDTEGGDLRTPKYQKAPELFLAIVRRLQAAGERFHVLLAGPRRHWIRERLVESGIPFTFVGKAGITGDDFGVNILSRGDLNELYSAADVYLIPSRWEGGPQSAMEAAACRCKMLSVPLGVARDILEPVSLFHNVREAVEKIRSDMHSDSLRPTIDVQHARWLASHTTAVMADGLRRVHAGLAARPDFQAKRRRRTHGSGGLMIQVMHTIRRRLGRGRLPTAVGWNHRVGHNAELDAILARVRELLGRAGVDVREPGGAGIEFVGVAVRPPEGVAVQWVVPGMAGVEIFSDATVVVPSVQDALNLRALGCGRPVVVCPVVEAAGEVSDEPFVVERGDREASMRVWGAMAAGRPVVYPDDSAYGEQVFHGGLRYSESEDPQRVAALARDEAGELRGLARVPGAGETAKFLRDLLLEMSKREAA